MTVQKKLTQLGLLLRKFCWSLSSGDDLPTRTCPSRRTSCTRPRKRRRGSTEEAPGAEPQLLLRGHEVPGMLQNHHRLQPRTNASSVCRLLHCALPAHGREGEAYKRMLLQAEAALKAPGIKMSGTLPQ